MPTPLSWLLECFIYMYFKFITLSVSVMIKGLRSRRPRLASKFPYFYHVRLFISTFLTCHSAIIDSLCFPYLSGGTRKNIWNDTFIENNPMATIQYSQTLFPILFCLHNSFKIVNCKNVFAITFYTISESPVFTCCI